MRVGCGDLTWFFFFQAEDGIRDLIVTGVQTCALPIFKGRGQEYVAVNLKNFVARYGRRVRETLDRARFGLVAERGLHADAVRVVDARARVCDGDDARAVFSRDEAREVRARVAEAVDGDARVAQAEAAHAARLAHGVEAAARRRLASPLRAAQRDGLSRHDAEFGVAVNHRKCVHDPGHRLLVCVNVGRGDVAVGADDGRDLEGVAPRETFEFTLRHRLRVAHHAALAAAVRYADRRALPGHPRGERLHLVERDVGVEAYAALRGAARDVVLHAVALEDSNLAAVHPDGDGDDELPLGVLQDLAHGLVEVEVVRGCLELPLRDLEGVQFFLSRTRRYR